MEFASIESFICAIISILSWFRREYIVRSLSKNLLITAALSISTKRAFRVRFALSRHDHVPDRKTIQNWVSNFRQTGSALKTNLLLVVTEPLLKKTALRQRWTLNRLLYDARRLSSIEIERFFKNNLWF